MSKLQYEPSERYKILDADNKCVCAGILRKGDAESTIDGWYEEAGFTGDSLNGPYNVLKYYVYENTAPYMAELVMKNDFRARTFLTKTKEEYNELVQIDEKNDLIKIYCQNTELGFPFSEHNASLKEFGYESADDYYNSISQRERAILNKVQIRELDTYSQSKAEVDGLFNLAQYRMEHGSYNSIILNDGSKYNDIVERLSAYGIDKQNVLDKLEGLISQTMSKETQYDAAIEEAITSAELPEPDMGMEV